MDETIGRVVINGGVQVGKLLNVQHGNPIVDPNPQCLAVGGHLKGWNSEVR